MQIDRLIRSLVKPYSGAFTFYRDRKGFLNKLYIWKSRVVEKTSDDVAVPGHILQNDHKTGFSRVMCGEGILELQECSHDEDEEIFSPGNHWKSIRMRLGLNLESEIYEFYRTR